MRRIQLTGWPLWGYGIVGIGLALVVQQEYILWAVIPYFGFGSFFYTERIPLSVFNMTGKKLWSLIVAPFILLIMLLRGIVEM